METELSTVPWQEAKRVAEGFKQLVDQKGYPYATGVLMMVVEGLMRQSPQALESVQQSLAYHLKKAEEEA